MIFLSSNVCVHQARKEYAAFRDYRNLAFANNPLSLSKRNIDGEFGF